MKKMAVGSQKVFIKGEGVKQIPGAEKQDY